MAESNYTPKICSVESCNSIVKANGYCGKHYTQLRRGGIKHSLKNCVTCNETINSLYSNAIYCSEKCKTLAWREAKGKEYISALSRRYIVKKCAVNFNKCSVCFNSFVSRLPSSICSKECAKIKSKKNSQEIYKSQREQKKFTCKECSIEFFTNCYDKRRVFCSDKCSERYTKRAFPRKASKLAIKYGVKYEPVNKIKVFDRDGWKCQICGENTPRRLMGKNNPKSPELDHRQPISKGGDHTYMNTQCSCRQCNGIKSNKATLGQFPLFN